MRRGYRSQQIPARSEAALAAALVAVTLPIALAAAAPSRARAADGTLTMAQYRDLIAACRKAAAAKGHRLPPAARAHLQGRLAAVHIVTDGSGRPLIVDTTPLRRALDSSADQSDTAVQFASLESVLGAGAAQAHSRGDAAAQAKAVLASPEFAGKRGIGADDDTAPAWWKNFRRWARRTWERFAAWLKRLLRRLHAAPLPAFGSAPGVARFMQFLLYFLIGVAALVALGLLARAATAGGWFDGLLGRRRRRSDDGEDALAFDLTGEGIADPLAAAKERAARGAYRDAVRLAYIASLRRLEGSGLLILEPNQTNWEYQRALRRRSRPVHDLLLPATRLFDRVWYGRRPATQEEFDGVVRVYESLPARAASPAPAASSADDATDALVADSAEALRS